MFVFDFRRWLNKQKILIGIYSKLKNRIKYTIESDP